ncbi:MAG: hypothetical protein WB586_07575 [Chthoniobacterales bacterium]
MPRIKMTPTVRVALWTLRIYLLVLLTLIAIKFIRVFSSGTDQSPSPPVQSATPGTGKNVGAARGISPRNAWK